MSSVVCSSFKCKIFATKLLKLIINSSIDLSRLWCWFWSIMACSFAASSWFNNWWFLVIALWYENASIFCSNSCNCSFLILISDWKSAILVAYSGISFDRASLKLYHTPNLILSMRCSKSPDKFWFDIWAWLSKWKSLDWTISWGFLSLLLNAWLYLLRNWLWINYKTCLICWL